LKRSIEKVAHVIDEPGKSQETSGSELEHSVTGMDEARRVAVRRTRLMWKCMVMVIGELGRSILGKKRKGCQVLM
jgi:hypothetical protein